LGITNIKSDTKKKDDQNEAFSHLPDGQEAHWEIVQRILFIFAKLNPGNSYVQGI
jgi:TBC1 domain family member 13